MKNIAIIGGGNIAHSLAAAISEHQFVKVLTRRPEAWGTRMAYESGGVVNNCAQNILATNKAEDLSDTDIAFVALPQFATEECLRKVLPVFRSGTTVVFVPAPAKIAEYVNLIQKHRCFAVGVQRVPFIARTLEYGRLTRISDPRAVHKLVLSDERLKNDWSQYIPEWFGGEVRYLSSFLSLAFSNSNPLLHPARLFVLLREGENGKYRRCPYFYAEWTDESSELYVRADEEMRRTFAACSPDACRRDYESVLDHYEVGNPKDLTIKIRSIASFKSILAPWRLTEEGVWVPDFKSRYFTEDIPFGTRVIQSYARDAGVETPTIDMLVRLVDSIS